MLAKVEKIDGGDSALPLTEEMIQHVVVPGLDLSSVTFCGRYLSDGIMVTTIPNGDPVPKGSFKIDVIKS